MSKEKYLRVTMPDGSKWDVPASKIAHDRATYYANAEQTSDSDELDEVYNREYENTLDDDYEIKDWAAGNMNWDDVEEFAVKVDLSATEVDYQEGWVNGDKEIVEK